MAGVKVITEGKTNRLKLLSTVSGKRSLLQNSLPSCHSWAASEAEPGNFQTPIEQSVGPGRERALFEQSFNSRDGEYT
jgi:hypothetical protein